MKAFQKTILVEHYFKNCRAANTLAMQVAGYWNPDGLVEIEVVALRE